MYKCVLVAIDGSDTSNLGLREAIELAKDQHSALRLIHVIDFTMAYRRAQLEAPRLLLLGDGNGGEECFLGWRCIRGIAPEQNLAADAVQQRVGPMFSRLTHERQRVLDAGQSSSGAFRLCLNLG
jgi:nucleotide-binding universal stress UspA family protein